MSAAGDIASTSVNATVEQSLSVDYSRALRAIGQDLTGLFPRVLDIESDGTSFVARGESYMNPFESYRRASYKDFWLSLLGNRKRDERLAVEPARLTFERTYTPVDVERLERLYSAQRTGQLGRPDNYSLAERLRVMGHMVNSRNGRLKRLRKNADNLMVEYWDPNGDVRTAKLTTVIMYRNPDPPASGSERPRELWEGYDF
jgi:hypothetical protein